VAFSRDGGELAIGSKEAIIRRFDVRAGRVLPPLRHAQREVNALAWMRDGRLLSGGHDRSPVIFDPATGAELLRLEGHKDEVRAVSISPDERLLATASEDQTIFVWDLAAKSSIFTLARANQDPTTVSFHPDGTRLASGGKDTFVRLWDAKDGHLIWEVSVRRKVRAVAFSPDGRQLAVAGEDVGVYLLDPADGRTLARVR
jgi:WD40 repeat protein